MEDEEPLCVQWIEKSKKAQLAALELVSVAIDSAASRFYYAAYQAVTALMHSRGHHPPQIDGVQREGWTHEDTPFMVENMLKPVLTQGQRRQVAGDLRKLYRFRIYADYAGERGITGAQLEKIRMMSGRIVKVAQEILIDGRQRRRN
jgi:uncharacterized protein (UPF0332 family)